MSLCPLRILKWICKGTEQRLGIFFLQIISDGFVHEGEYGREDWGRMTIRSSRGAGGVDALRLGRAGRGVTGPGPAQRDRSTDVNFMFIFLEGRKFGFVPQFSFLS